MLRWALIFLIVALVAALFGFTGIAIAAAGIAKFLLFLFLVACLIFLLWAYRRVEEFPRGDPTISMRRVGPHGGKKCECLGKAIRVS
jgi:Small integral membrane protein